MVFESPIIDGFTIYTKSGCLMCTKAKELLQSKSLPYTMIDCDEYLLEDREGFLLFMKNLANKDVLMFPMICYNGCFVGAYKEMLSRIETVVPDVVDDIIISRDVTKNTIASLEERIIQLEERLNLLMALKTNGLDLSKFCFGLKPL